MSSNIGQIIEVESRFNSDIKGNDINIETLIGVIRGLKFTFARRGTSIKTQYDLGTTTIHYSREGNEKQYYYKETIELITTYKESGYKLEVSRETEADDTIIPDRQPSRVREIKQTVYTREDMSIFIRDTKPVTVEIEIELPGDGNPSEAVEKIRKVTERILMAISFESILQYETLYVTPREYKIITEAIEQQPRFGKHPPKPLKWQNLTVDEMADYYVSRKADGVRVYIFLVRGFGVYIISGAGFNIMKISDTVDLQTDVIILEGEYVNMNNQGMEIEPEIILHDIVASTKYANRITFIQEYMNKLAHLPIKIKMKEIIYTGLSRQSILEAITKIFGECTGPFDEISDRFLDDGIIFTPNRTNGDVYKWKPPERLTIDLMYLDGSLVYAKSRTKYPWRYDISNLQLTNKTIHEFLVLEDRSLRYVKPRPDRNEPNGYSVVQEVVELARNPITKDDLLGRTPALYRKYHNTVKRSLFESASRRGNVLLDIGSGKGGSILSYKHYKTVIAVDPSVENMNDLIKRASNLRIPTQILSMETTIDNNETTIYYHVGYVDENFLAIIIAKELVFDVISSFFTLQYICPISNISPIIVDIYGAGEENHLRQYETLRYILTEHMSPGSAFIGICLDYKNDLVPEITRQTICRGYRRVSDEPIAKHEMVSLEDRSYYTATFMIRDLPTLPYGHIDYMPVLYSYLSMFLPEEKLAVTGLSPLYAKNLITSDEWVDLSYYYTSFISADSRPVIEEISIATDYLHVSGVKENSIYNSFFMIGEDNAYEIGVIDSRLDACILSVLRQGFTTSVSRMAELENWSKDHPEAEKDKVAMIEKIFGVGMIIIKVLNGSLVTIAPDNQELSRYFYVFSDLTHYCLLATKVGDYYQTMYGEMHIITLLI